MSLVYHVWPFSYDVGFSWLVFSWVCCIYIHHRYRLIIVLWFLFQALITGSCSSHKIKLVMFPLFQFSEIWEGLVFILCCKMDGMCCIMPGFPVPHHLPEFGQVHVHCVGDTIRPSSSVAPFSCLQSFPTSGSFPVGWLFAPGGQSIGVSASASVLPMNIQNWFPLGLTGLISLWSKGLSRVLPNTIVQKYHFFSAQPSLWSNLSHPYMTTGKSIVLTRWTFVGNVSAF